MHYYYYPTHVPVNYCPQTYHQQTMPAWGGNAYHLPKGKKAFYEGQYSAQGNICAYAPDGPVKYNKLNIKHFPSDDYKTPHPKGWLHTIHTSQHLGAYVPFRKL